jgi:hypothetical protein
MLASEGECPLPLQFYFKKNRVWTETQPRADQPQDGGQPLSPLASALRGYWQHPLLLPRLYDKLQAKCSSLSVASALENIASIVFVLIRIRKVFVFIADKRASPESVRVLTAARALKDADALPQLLVSLLTHAAAPITRKLHGRQIDEGFSIEGVVCTHGIAPYLLGLLRIIVRLLQASNSIAYSAEVQKSICDHEVTWTPHPSPNVLGTYEEPHRLLRLVLPLEMQPILIAQCAEFIGWSFLLAKPLSCVHASQRQHSNPGSSHRVTQAKV